MNPEQNSSEKGFSLVSPTNSDQKRLRLTSRQLSLLQQTLKQTPYPSASTRDKLALELGMTPRSVQIWFQNQRQRRKYI